MTRTTDLECHARERSQAPQKQLLEPPHLLWVDLEGVEHGKRVQRNSDVVLACPEKKPPPLCDWRRIRLSHFDAVEMEHVVGDLVKDIERMLIWRYLA